MTEKNFLGPFTLLPPKPDACQDCAVVHQAAAPHNKDSLYYQYSFYANHGRWPTWEDAIAHCDHETRTKWTEALTERGIKLGRKEKK